MKAFLLLFLSNSLRTIKSINNGKKEGVKNPPKNLRLAKNKEIIRIYGMFL